MVRVGCRRLRAVPGRHSAHQSVRGFGKVEHHGCRFLHLLDSHVNLAHAAKGRGSSLRMRHVELKTNATLLASRMRDINGYTRSDRNPADAASRDKRRWADDRRQRRRAASAPRHPELAAPAPLRRLEP